MSNIDSNTLADAIRNFVRQQNGSVSFVELSRQLPGIDGDFGLFPDGDGKISNVCFWPCLSQQAAASHFGPTVCGRDPCEANRYTGLSG